MVPFATFIGTKNPAVNRKILSKFPALESSCQQSQRGEISYSLRPLVAAKARSVVWIVNKLSSKSTAFINFPSTHYGFGRYIILRPKLPFNFVDPAVRLRTCGLNYLFGNFMLRPRFSGVVIHHLIQYCCAI
jgi:hypothetical protein